MKTKALTILFFICQFVQAQQTNDSLFNYKADVRLFTVYAFMNSAGYNHEWRQAGMHPIRIALRKDLEGILDSTFLKKITDFRSGHDQGSWVAYGTYAFITSGPPEFQLSFDSITSSENCKEIARTYAGLSPLLREFYKQTNMAILWEKYRPMIQARNDLRKPFANRALDDIVTYCRIDKDFFSKKANQIHYQFAPLLSYFTAQTEEVNGDIYIIAGPQEGEPSESEFYHEALHHVTNPLIESLDRNVYNKFNELFRLADSTSQAGYCQFYEGFVRTLDKVISGKHFGDSDSTIAERINNEYKLGFVLCPSIFGQLKQYEASQMTLSEYFPEIVANIDIAAVRQSWLEMIKSPK